MRPLHCSAVLNKLTGKKVPVETLVSRVILLDKGTTGDRQVKALKSEGLSAWWNFSTFPKDLEMLTAKGRPVIAKVKVDATNNHWIVEDGAIARPGRKAVAIRDPGFESEKYRYCFELWETFSARDLKEAVIPNQ